MTLDVRADVPDRDGFTFHVYFDPAWDLRATDPNRGQHGAQMRFAVIGPLGAVAWTLFTGWDVDSTKAPIPRPVHGPIAAGWFVHWRVPEGTKDAHECEYVGWCYQEGMGSLIGDPFYQALVLGGFERVLTLLLERYDEHLNEGITPPTAETPS